MSNAANFTQLLEAAKQKAEATRLAAPPRDTAVTPEVVNKFLDYVCKFKKHKGKTWRDVLMDDYDYFVWCVTKAMKKDTRTYEVFSTLL